MGGLEMGKAGMERWHQRDAGQWQALIGRQAGSRLSVAHFCWRGSISTGSYYRWRRRLGIEVEDGPDLKSSLCAGD